ncbi:Polyketide cyclase/dehydrase and lipid transport superfamily protein [Euphorbia peplus]|nr:Polyketide cyclase/dehydrase and lipid transport superfamily protein [Euphorbia peplus]
MAFLILGLAFLVGLFIGWNWKPKWLSFPNPPPPPPYVNPTSSSSHLNEEQSSLVNCLTNEDVQHLHNLVHVKDAGPAWIPIMDRSAPGMTYQAWTRNPISGPTQYRSRTVFENAMPELVRDFFWDDEFRAKWDDMLAYSNTLHDCALTGTMLVQWIRKFPFFCREYIIVRRIWESNGSFYCVTKGVNCPAVPRRGKPKRVDLYYSSWYIRAVKSRGSEGEVRGCEVIFFHHEEMGIPREIAKLGVRQGMWGTVKKFEPSFRAYQKERSSGIPLSRSAFMAQITTKINLECLGSTEQVEKEGEDKRKKMNIPKWLVIGGTMMIVCSIDKGWLTDAFMYSLGRRFANIGKRLQNRLSNNYSR